MKKDRIHIYEMESYKHASEEQRNSMRICKIRYFDLEGLPSREVKEILEAFIWERGKTLALSSLATELTIYNKDYVRMLLFLEDKGKLTVRTMGVIEKDMQTIYSQPSFRIDYCVGRMEVDTVCKLRRGISYRFQTYYGYQ